MSKILLLKYLALISLHNNSTGFSLGGIRGEIHELNIFRQCHSLANMPSSLVQYHQDFIPEYSLEIISGPFNVNKGRFYSSCILPKFGNPTWSSYVKRHFQYPVSATFCYVRTYAQATISDGF